VSEISTEPNRVDVRRNAIFHITQTATEFELPKVPAQIHVEEARRALAPSCPTGLIPLDASAALKTRGPATTPLMLARYVVVRAGESLEHHFQATGEVYCVIRGAGTTTAGSASIAWKSRDVFCLPGASRTRHEANEDSLMLVVTDEPQLEFLRLPAPDPARNEVVPATLWDAETMEARIGDLHADTTRKAPGKAVVFTVPSQKSMRSVLPSMTSSINTLEPGGAQRLHRHNAASITLALESEGVYSMIAGQRFDWAPFAVLVIPPALPHSHHNEGSRMMKSITFLDGPLWHAARNSGFSNL
jgi:gentisate 1,2-dioxygenase